MEIEKKDLEQIVYQKLKKLPEFFRKKLVNIEFFVETEIQQGFWGFITGSLMEKEQTIIWLCRTK